MKTLIGSSRPSLQPITAGTRRRRIPSWPWRPTAIRTALAAFVLICAAPGANLSAAELFWDANDVKAGTGGDGTWNLSSPVWSPRADGIRLDPFAPPPFNTGLRWPNAPDAVAIFGGTAGTVDLAGVILAGGLRFATTNYVLRNGTLQLANLSAIEVADDVTATLASQLQVGSGDAPNLNVTGRGTLVLASPAGYDGTLTVAEGRLRAGTADTLRDTTVILSGPLARFDTGGLPSLNVRALNAATRLDLGNTVLNLTGRADLEALTLLQNGVGGSALSGLRVGTAGIASLSVRDVANSNAASELGFLHLLSGNSALFGVDVRLSATGSQGFGGNSSLFIEDGAALGLQDGTHVVASSNVQLHNNALLNVLFGSTLSAVRDPGNPAGLGNLRIGFAGATSRALVSGIDSQVQAADVLQLGGVFAPNPGVGELTLSDGGRALAPVLSFGSTASQLVINANSQARFNRFDSRIGLGEAGTITLNGGELVIGDETLTTRLAATPSVFSGKLTGASGTLRKIGAGTTTLTHEDSDFGGTVNVDAGTLSVGLRTLQNAMLTLAPGATLLTPSSGESLAIGALHGAFDFAPGTGSLVLGGNKPRFASFGGHLSLEGTLRKIGASTQHFTNGADLGAIDVQDGLLLLRTGTYAMPDADAFIHVGVESTTNSRLQLANRAVVDLREGVARVYGYDNKTSRLDVSAGARLDVGDLEVAGSGGALQIGSGAVVTVARTLTLVDESSVVVDRGSLITTERILDNFRSSVALSDPNAPFGATAFTAPVAWTVNVTPNASDMFPHPFFTSVTDATSGPGSLAFVGQDFRLTFAGAPQRYTGRTIVDGTNAVVELFMDIASREFVARNGGRFELGSRMFASGKTFRTDASSTISFISATMSGGLLRGAGFSSDVAPSAFTGTTLGVNSRFVANTSTIWRDGTLSGALDARAAVQLEGVAISAAGKVSTQGDLALTDVENSGHIELQRGARATVAGTLTSGGGSRLSLAAEATLAGDLVALNGALLINNGTLSAPLEINYLGTAKGAGRFGEVTVNDGGTFAPGNSPGLAQTGSVTLNAGGRFEVEIVDPLGAPGVGFDLWEITGNVDFNAGTTANSAFTIALKSLRPDHAPGPLAGFDQAARHAWTILSADTVTGFDPAEVLLDLAGFANAHDGQFSLALAGIDGRIALQVLYQPVPLPGAQCLLLGALGLLWTRRRRA